MMSGLTFRIAAPVVVISLMLLGLGVSAAWYVQRQQATSQNVIVSEIEELLATQSLYMRSREILHLLQECQRTGDVTLLTSISSLQSEADSQVKAARQWPRTAAENLLMEEIDAGFAEFWSRLAQLLARTDAANLRPSLDELSDQVLMRRVVEPSERYMKRSHTLMERTNEASRRTTDLTRQGFLLLGLCGCAGGLIAGWGAARLIQRSLVQLNISVRSVVGRLGAKSDPVTVTRVGEFQELEAGLSQMERHIVDLVERLQQSETQMLRNEQLAHLGKMAAGLAHELRNPLMPIKTLVQTAIERGPERGMSIQSLEVIDREIRRIEQSIQSFLDFARPQQPTKTHIDLIEQLRHSIELVSARATRQQIAIALQTPDEPVCLDADAAQIHQVVLNLLLNAFDALPHGGRIEVSANRVANDDATDRVVLTIRDSGTGLPEHVLEHLFEPFTTTKETGTGLGLSICQRLIEGHGGTIVAGNRPCGGAEFVITLPVSKSDPRSLRPQ